MGLPYKRKDGMWVGAVSITGTDGKRRRKTVSSTDYNTAVAELRKLRKKVAEGQVPVTGSTTVAKWLEHWLETIQRPNVRPTTYRYYEAAVRLYLLPHLGGKRLDRLTPEHVRAMHRAVQADTVDDQGEVLRPGSTRNAQKAQQVLQRALKDAEGEGLLVRNVAAAVRKPRHAAADKGTLSLEVAAHILNTAEASRDPLASRWAVAFWTGARQGELLGLTWDHVDLEAGTIELAWQLQMLGKTHGCGEPKDGTYPCGHQRPGFCPTGALKPPPGFEARPCHKSLFWTKPKSKAGVRVVPILPAVVDILTAHKAGDTNNPHNLLWHHPDQRPYSPTEDAKAWKALLVKAKVDHVGVHVIRHSTATILQAAGVDEMTRMALMGHSSAAAQRGYLHLDQSTTRRGLEVLNALTGKVADRGPSNVESDQEPGRKT